MALFKKLFKSDKEKEKDKVKDAPKDGGAPAPVQEKLKKDDFEVLDVLGKGSFAQVVLARRITTGQIFAMKVVTKQGLLDHKRVQDVFVERNILTRSNHPYLLKLYNTFQSEHKLYFVMDYMPGGDLDKYMNAQPNKLLDLFTAKLYGAEILLALGYLHQHKVIYRDLKPENILMTAQGHCVLADFGLSKDFHVDGGDDNATNEMKAHSFVGSPFYVSPDVLKQKEYTEAVDFWSFGILLYRMLAGRPPFSGRNMKEVFDNIMFTELRFPSSVQVDETAKDLISRLLVKDATKRLKLDQIRAHPFWKDFTWDDVMAVKIAPPKWVVLPSAEQLVAQKANAGTLKESGAHGVVQTPADQSALPQQHQKYFEGFSCSTGSALGK